MIRPALESDLSAILAIYGPYILTSTATFEYEVPSLSAFTDRFRGITAQFPWLVWEQDGEILGYAYASAPYSRPAYAWCAEPSIYLRPEARGLGIGAALYKALEAILLEQGYQVLYALITQENTRSLRFHEKLGYREMVLFPDCGFKFGRWLGLIWMEKRLKIVEIPTSYPTPWSTIIENAQNFGGILDILSLF
ncbi:MAG: N-acetyltransferase family protein [Candidatus Faecousia sp.]|nr:N-acetyltransferase family protein [Clostridiales bacterium]MDY6180072.1 N-acetyltransferase family protein [Candidatus Faecousia sp.]